MENFKSFLLGITLILIALALIYFFTKFILMLVTGILVLGIIFMTFELALIPFYSIIVQFGDILRGKDGQKKP